MTWITPETSDSIPSRTGLNITVCPSIFSAGTGKLTMGGLIAFFGLADYEIGFGTHRLCGCRWSLAPACYVAANPPRCNHVRTRRDFDSLGRRLGLRYPGGFAVHVARPSRFIFS